MGRSRSKLPPSPFELRLGDRERRTFLEQYLKASEEEGRRELSEYAVRSYMQVSNEMKERAWELRQAEETFGKTDASSYVIRRLEAWAEKVERNLELRLWDFRKRELEHEAWLKATELRARKRQQLREWRARKRIEAAERAAREWEEKQKGEK